MNQLRNTQQRLQRYSQNIVQFERDLNTAQSLIPVLEENDRDLASQITSLNNELWFLKTNIDQNTLEYVRGGVL
jgi:CII-binding regulator of phage lambda lysogenization HflD